MAEYLAALRQLSEFCSFGEKVNDMLRDKLVVGINDERIQRKLLTESYLTFEKAQQIALAIELADKSANDFKQTSSTPVHYNSHKAGHTKSTSTSTPKSVKTVKCYRCGGNHHSSACHYIDFICRACCKRGHLERVCHTHLSLPTHLMPGPIL